MERERDREREREIQEPQALWLKAVPLLQFCLFYTPPSGVLRGLSLFDGLILRLARPGLYEYCSSVPDTSECGLSFSLRHRSMRYPSTFKSILGFFKQEDVYSLKSTEFTEL